MFNLNVKQKYENNLCTYRNNSKISNLYYAIKKKNFQRDGIARISISLQTEALHHPQTILSLKLLACRQCGVE